MSTPMLLVAVDLISQAEHDEQASAVLVTWSQELADRVRAEVERRSTHRNAARDDALDGPQSAIVSSTIVRRPRRSATRTHRSTSNCTSRTRVRRTSSTPVRCSSARTRP
jgi:DNA anti-recombination protein RmuC